MSEKNNKEGVGIVYLTPSSSVSTVFSANSTTSSSGELGQQFIKKKPSQLDASVIKSNPLTTQYNSDINSSFSSSITGPSKSKKSKNTTTGDQGAQALYNPNNKNNEFEIFKELESVLERKADDLEKNLLLKQTEAKGALETSLRDALSDINLHKTETKEELKETRNSVLGTIALFAAFFTFVSVNVNIFTKAETVAQSIIFMLSFWLCIIGFISLFFFFLNKTQNTIWYKSLEFYTTLLCVLFTVILMFLLFKNSNHDSYKKINEEISKIKSENTKLTIENSELNKKISIQLKNMDEQIIELRKNQYQLNNQ